MALPDLATADLLAGAGDDPAAQPLAPGAVLLRGFATSGAAALLQALEALLDSAPWRHMTVPGGGRMSVAMSNCGAFGWTSSPAGYRYLGIDPDSGRAWPPMPAAFSALARAAAERAGHAGFTPDACLMNRYAPGARLALHQDRDEAELTHPIVSVSLGLPAEFLFGGLTRREAPARLVLVHGDVLVWGGPSRLRFHGVRPLADGVHAATGRCRINLTFRRAGPAAP